MGKSFLHKIFGLFVKQDDDSEEGENVAKQIKTDARIDELKQDELTTDDIQSAIDRYISKPSQKPVEVPQTQVELSTKKLEFIKPQQDDSEIKLTPETKADSLSVEESEEKAQSEESEEKAQSKESEEKAQSEESEEKAQSEESEEKAQSEESEEKAQSEESKEKAQSEESKEKEQEEPKKKRSLLARLIAFLPHRSKSNKDQEKSEDKKSDENTETTESQPVAEVEVDSQTSEKAKDEDNKKTPKISFVKLKKLHEKVEFDFDKVVPENDEMENFSSTYPITFSKVFRFAKIKPPKDDMSLIHLADAIDGIKEDPKYLGYTREQIKETIFQVMKSHKVSAVDLLQDALIRDKALDTYEEFIAERIKNRRENMLMQNRDLEEKIRKNKEWIESEEAYLERWIADKEMLEERMLMACAYIGDTIGEIVTIGSVTKGNKGRSQYKKE